jgi:hypothetical protein
MKGKEIKEDGFTYMKEKEKEEAGFTYIQGKETKETGFTYMQEKEIKAAGFTPGEAVVEDGEEDEYGVEAGENNQQVVEGVPHGVAGQHVHRQQVPQQAHQSQEGLWDRAAGHWVSQQVIGLVTRSLGYSVG